MQMTGISNWRRERLNNDPSSVKRIHLIGICGTAMASLAGMLQAKGYQVAGSDQSVYPPMSTFLERLGIQLFEGFSEKNLVPRPDLVVVGNVVSRGNPEVEQTLNEKIRYASMAEVLKEFFIRGKRSYVVSGTHGKTTTASLLAWLLESAGLDPSFLVGGIAENFGSSFKLGKSDLFVIEGDEYDTAFFDKGPKFLHYLPERVILNNCEFDHADIYADFEAVKTSFRRLVNIIPSRGKLIANWDDAVVRELSSKAFCPVESFGLASEAQWTARSWEFLEATTRFEAVRNGVPWGRFETPLAGGFNIKNCLAAIACASDLGVSSDRIEEGLRTFKNVKRRLEIRGEARGVTIFDDFAHHPTAIHETLSAVKARYPGSRLWAIFEPRSATSRRNVFQQEFATCFDKADRVVLCSLFAPEKLDASVRLDVARVVQELRARGIEAWQRDSADAIVQEVAPRLKSGDKVLIMSNGGFDGIHQKLLNALNHRADG
jgi:UDP-N-acetylmuramate: L-alanyl-gamma-D-glutamyl-meso-diaminopimelate ligase